MCLWPEDYINDGVLLLNDGELKARVGHCGIPAVTFLEMLVDEKKYSKEKILSIIDRMTVKEDIHTSPIYKLQIEQLKKQADSFLKSSKRKKGEKEIKKFFGPAGS